MRTMKLISLFSLILLNFSNVRAKDFDHSLQGQGIDFETFKILPREDQRKVVGMMQVFAIQQEAIHAQYKKTPSYSFLDSFNKLFIEESFALTNNVNVSQKLCYYGGWLSLYYNGRCSHPKHLQTRIKNQTNDVKSQLQPHLNAYNTAREQYSKQNKCEEPGMIFCNPSLFGHNPKNNEAFCVRGNNNSVNTSYLCMAAVDGRYDITEFDETIPEDQQKEHKNKILDKIIDNALASETAASEFKVMLLNLFDVCMCNQSNIISNRYKDQIFNHRTCMALNLQTNNILDRLIKRSNQDPQVCTTLTSMGYSGGSLTNMLEFSSLASDSIIEQYTSVNEYNRNKFKVPDPSNAAHQKHISAELASLDRRSKVAKLKEIGVCPINYNPTLSLTGADTDKELEYRITARVFSLDGENLEVVWDEIANTNTTKIISNKVRRVKKLASEYTVTAYLKKYPNITAKTIIPSSKEGSCYIRKTVAEGKIKLDVTPIPEGHGEIKWLLDGEQANSEGNILELEQPEEVTEFKVSVNYRGPLREYNCELSFSSDNNDENSDDKNQCEIKVAETDQSKEDAVDYTLRIEEAETQVSWSIAKDKEGVQIEDINQNSSKVTIPNGTQVDIVATYEQRTEQKQCSVSLGESDPSEDNTLVGELSIEANQTKDTASSESFEAFAKKEGTIDKSIAITWCYEGVADSIVAQAEDEEKDDNLRGPSTEAIVEEEPGETESQEVTLPESAKQKCPQGQTLKVTRQDYEQKAFAFITERPEIKSQEFTIEAKNTSEPSDTPNFQFRPGQPPPDPSQFLNNRPKVLRGLQ
jgi:hypothetical protein